MTRVTITDEPNIGSVVLTDLGEAFQRMADGYWRSGAGRSHGWRYLVQAFSPITLLAARDTPPMTPEARVTANR